jgi:hypothetical protein
MHIEGGHDALRTSSGKHCIVTTAVDIRRSQQLQLLQHVTHMAAQPALSDSVMLKSFGTVRPGWNQVVMIIMVSLLLL